MLGKLPLSAEMPAQRSCAPSFPHCHTSNDLSSGALSSRPASRRCQHLSTSPITACGMRSGGKRHHPLHAQMLLCAASVIPNPRLKIRSVASEYSTAKQASWSEQPWAASPDSASSQLGCKLQYGQRLQLGAVQAVSAQRGKGSATNQSVLFQVYCRVCYAIFAAVMAVIPSCCQSNNTSGNEVLGLTDLPARPPKLQPHLPGPVGKARRPPGIVSASVSKSQGDKGTCGRACARDSQERVQDGQAPPKRRKAGCLAASHHGVPQQAMHPLSAACNNHDSAARLHLHALHPHGAVPCSGLRAGLPSN